MSLKMLFLSFCFSFLSTSKTRGRCLPQEGGRHAAVRQHRLQADLVCHGEAGGERPRQVHRPVQLQQPADRRRPLCGQHQTHRAAGASRILTPDRFNVHVVLARFGFNVLMAFGVWQVEGHPYVAQVELLAHCRDRGLVMTAYSPLGSPDRAWKHPDEPVLLQEPAIISLADKYKKSPAQIILR